MNHGRQLRLFLADGTSSGPRFYEIVNRTIQALCIPATRIKELTSIDWPEIQKSGVYLVHGTTESAEERLYIGKGENVASRVKGHPEKLDFDVLAIIIFTSKDENLNASQVGWLESRLIGEARGAKRITVTNVALPSLPVLPRAEQATVQEFLEDLILIAQTAGFDYFTKPESNFKGKNLSKKAEFHLVQQSSKLAATGYPSDQGFVVKAGSDAKASVSPKGLSPGYTLLHQKLVLQGVLVPKSGHPQLLSYIVDYAFSSPSAAAAITLGNNTAGTTAWKLKDGMTLGEYLASQASPTV